MATVIPAWIKERKNESELTQARHETETQKQLAASLLIQRDGPEFWERYMNALKINTDALSEISLRSSMSLTGNLDTEVCCGIQVVREGYISQQASLNIFYSKKNFAVIRCRQFSSGFDLPLSVHENKIVVMSREGDYPLTPERLAEETVKRLVEIVENGQSAI